MRHSRLPFVVALAITAGCSASDNSLGPKPPQLRRESALDCEETAEQCAQIQRGIDYLKNHANPMCRAAGSNAQQRYDAPSGEGFRPEPDFNGYDMSVYDSPYPSDGYTNVYPKFQSGGWSDAATGALIAHEEIHHIGGGEVSATSVQNDCLNPQG